MEISRNQYYLAGLVVLFLGIQFRMIDSVQVKQPVATFLAERTGHPVQPVNSVAQAFGQTDGIPLPAKYHPEEWIGWLLLSIGSVLILHSWAMQKSGG